MSSGKRNSEYIRHEAVIVSLEGRNARVQIVRPSACDSCDASRGCGVKKGKKIVVDITDDRLSEHKVGDVVSIEMSSSAGRRAVAVGFAVPLVVFVAVLLAMHSSGSSDGFSAVVGLCSLVVYYLIIYILRVTLERRFVIRLTK